MMKLYARPLMATLLAALIAFGTLPQASAQNVPGSQAPSSEPKPANSPSPTVSLGSSKFQFTRAPKGFPNLIAPYKPITISEIGLTNTPKIEQMIHDGKLELTLQDAVELALANNMDIVVARYNPWLADVDILASESGGSGRGTPGGAIGFSNARLPILSFDPIVTGTVLFDHQSIPINNPFTSGSGTSTLNALQTHTAEYNFGVSQGFSSGTAVGVSWDNTRSSSSSPVNSFNPAVQSSLSLNVSQQLLNGFGFFANRRNILISKNNRKIADLAFAQQAITTITNTVTAYWELVYARQNVDVQQQAVTVSEKLYGDNKEQLEIGTMAPLDVTRAESELATDRQNLIVAQTAQLQQTQVLKNAISKNPLAPNMINVEIIPTDLPTRPEAIEAPSFEQSVAEAFAKRPDVQEQAINLQNGQIDLGATRNALLPTATLTAQYGSVGLAGNQTQVLTTTPGLGTQLVDSTGAEINAFIPTQTPATTQVVKGGLGDAMSNVFHNNFPDYNVQLNVQIPIRNRSAQADNQRAILTQRQLEAQMQQLKNSALLDVRNTFIALQQDRARVEAASKARELQQQTFDAEQKKYQLGASTVYLVIQTQRDLISAQGTELRALTDLVEAKANYERALGRTLEVNRVTVADAKSGQVDQATLIPGTLHGQVFGMAKVYLEIESNSGQK